MPSGHKPPTASPIARGGVKSADDWLARALGAAGDAAYAWHPDTGAMRWSPDARAVLGAAAAPTREAFLARVAEEDRAGLLDRLRRHGETGAPFEIEYRLDRGQDVCWVQDRGTPCPGRGGGVAGVLRVVTARKQLDARLARLVNYDDLTGHYNASRLREALDHAMARTRRYGATGAYLLAEIDDLGLLADAYGAEVTDAVVVAVGQQLDLCLRKSDVVGRVARARFGVVLDVCRKGDVDAIMAKIAAAVRGMTVDCDFGQLRVAVSLTAVNFPGVESSSAEVMARADARLRDRPWRPGAQHGAGPDDVRSDLAVAERLRWCLENDKIDLAFQPIVAAGSGEVALYECLMRPTGDGAVSPGVGQLMRVAERTGVVRQIDRRVLELAVDELEAEPGLNLALNVSGLTTSDPQWLRRLTGLVHGRADLASRLTVEITETAALHDVHETARFVATLRDVGCRVALDDFGAGHTSFRNLKALGVDLVKIDGAFVTGLTEDAGDLAFVHALQSLAGACGLATVAECVEDAPVAGILTECGVDYLQGYHFGRPTLSRPWRAIQAADAALNA